MPTIYGDTLDAAGRCTHYHSEKDVIANKCATCDKYWACYECHAAATDHSFGAMDLKSLAEAMVSCCSMAFVTCPVLIAGRALIRNHVFLRVVMRAASRGVESISVNCGHGRKFSPR